MCLSIIMAILAATGLATIPLLIILALVIGTVNSIDMPVRQAFAVEMVGREDIGNAVALNSAMFNGARIIGPAVAGLVIGAVGVTMAFVVDAASFLAVIVGLAMMRDSELMSPARIARPESFDEAMVQLREGLHYVRVTPAVLIAVVVVGLVSTVGMNFSVIIPPYADEILDSGASGYGFLMAASGVGSLLAALWLAFGRGARIRWIGYGAIMLGVAEVGLGATASYPIALLMMIARRLRRDPDGRDRQHDDAAGGPRRPARTGHGRVHHDLRGLDPDRRADDGRPRLALRDRGVARHRRRAGGRRGRRVVGLDPPTRPRPRRPPPGPAGARR